MNDVLRFEPPKDELFRYALWIDGGFFRQYKHLGAAKTAYASKSWYRRNREARILELIDGEWYTLYRVAADRSENDPLPWQKKVEINRYSSWGPITTVRATPMTRDEYAAFRVAVERERVARRHQINVTMPNVFPVNTR